jgi:ABC-type multidrug transport system fused ATPase/permease subunit
MAEHRKISVSLLFGLIAAGSMILFILGTYWAGPKVFIGEIAYLGYAILIGLAAAAALAQKKINGGWLGFQQAIRICFIVLVLGLVARTLFPWLLVNVIDPHFKQLLLPEIAVRTEAVYRRFGMPEDQIRRALEAEKAENPFALGSMLMGFALACIVHFFIALLIAAVVKRKKNEPAGAGI